MSESTSSCACPELLAACCWLSRERREKEREKDEEECERGSVVRGRCLEIVLGLVYCTEAAGDVEVER